MTYELAKKLKEAGFPQYRPQHVDDAYSSDGKGKHMWQHWTVTPLEEFNDPDAIKIPSLSDLIAACGEGFTALLKTDEHEWKAGRPYDNDLLNSMAPTGIGSTPEEAVAQLWLALTG